MALFPILRRELLSLARSRGTYWTRSGVALLGILICVQSLGSGSFGIPAAAGRFVFNLVVGAAFLVSCSACFLSADAISAERRQGTLELLFLTRVRPLDVLLGKLGSVGMVGLCSLAAFLPALMIPVLAGGVTGGEALRKGLVLINVLALALAAGLFASSAQVEKARAIRRAVAFVSLAEIVPYLVFASATQSVPQNLGLISPLASMVVAGELRYAAEPAPFWRSLLFGQAFVWLLLTLAALRLRQEVSGKGQDEGARAIRARVESARAVGLGTWEPDKGDSAPVEWLVYRRSGVSGGIWAAGLLALAYSSWVSLARQPAGRAVTAWTWVFAWPLGITAGFIGGAMIVWGASRFFMGIRRSGDLELLLTTPLGAETVISEQWQALKRLFVWPVLIMQAPMIPQFLATMVPGNSISPDVRVHLVIFKLLVLVNSLLGAMALCRVGMWLGFKAATQAGAIAWGVGLVRGIPALVSLIGSIVGSMLIESSGRQVWIPMNSGFHPRYAAVGYAAASWLPELVNLALFLGLIGLAMQKLKEELAGLEPGCWSLSQSIVRGVRVLRADWRPVRAQTPS